MARPNQEEVDTFMSVTGLPESVAVQKLEEHGGNLNAALNAHFNEGDRNTANTRSVADVDDDLMDIDEPSQLQPRGHPLPLLSSAIGVNPFSLLDDNFRREYFDGITDFPGREPFVSHPREVREIPIEVRDGNGPSGHSGSGPVIEDVTGSEYDHGPEVRGTVVLDEEDSVPVASAPAVQHYEREDTAGITSRDRNAAPTASFATSPDIDYVEEEMIRAAIEASRREIEGSSHVQNDFTGPGYVQRQSHQEDPELAHAVSLSLKTSEQEKGLLEQEHDIGASKSSTHHPSEVELGKIPSSNGRLELGSSSVQDEVEEVDQPLIRRRSGRVASRSVEPVQETEGSHTPFEETNADTHPQLNGSVFPSDEWGGISSEEHDEAVMLEAAMFGGIPEGTGYNFPYAPHQFMQAERHYPRRAPRPPSPSLEAQRLIREQQDDEYLASLQADQEKELKAKAEAEARRIEEEAARRAALEEERRKEEESRRKLEEEQEFERLLAAKEASLPKEPNPDDENAVTLQVRLPDGSRRGRRFLKSDKLQLLFDFIDVGKAVKPGTYRLVRPYPRRAFGDGESGLTLNELGLTSRQEALFLELI